MYTSNSDSYQHSIGEVECAAARELHQHRFDSVREAQDMADAICIWIGWEPVKVVFSKRNATRINGIYWHIRNEIVLTQKGENLTTLVHELAHKAARGHGTAFKDAFLLLTHLARHLFLNNPYIPPQEMLSWLSRAERTTTTQKVLQSGILNELDGIIKNAGVK